MRVCLFFFCFIVTSIFQLRLFAQEGCTDPLANNFDADAVENDGSCAYNSTNIPLKLITKLTSILGESSGLMCYNGQLWTHNDSGGEAVLYAIDTLDGEVLKKIVIGDAEAVDWEDICKDNDFVYIADIGNNEGSRKNLCIYRFPLSGLDSDTVTADKIGFVYPDQTDFTPRNQDHNFDAEALVAMGDSLYIFSKNWKDQRCKLYALPKIPGNFVARLAGEYNTGTMITGADYSPEDKVLLLTAYNKVLTPSMLMLRDFHGRDAFSGNKRKFEISQALHQFEAVAFSGEIGKFYISNEKLGSVPARLFFTDINRWIKNTATATEETFSYIDYKVFPQPASQEIRIQWNSNARVVKISIADIFGQILDTIQVQNNANNAFFSIASIPTGIYFLILDGELNRYPIRFIKQ